MPYKKKATPGTVQLNELIDELPEKRRLKNRFFNSDMTF